MLNRLLNSKTKTVGLTAFLLAISAFLSQLLGLLRDNLLANSFSKEMTDVYFAAFRIPDFVFAVVITGGVGAAFLPVFAETFKKNPAEAKRLSRAVLSFFLFSIILISFILFLLAPQLVDLIAPGFSLEQKALTAIMSRLMFLSPIFLGISAIFSGILQFFNIFLATALAPIFYNLGIIIGILFFSRASGLKGLAFGVILGAFLHFLIQLPPFLKSGFSLKPLFDRKVYGLKKIFYLMVPRIIGSTANHFNLIITTAIASTLPAGAVSIFNFSNNIQSFPASLIGVSFTTAIFPFLSKTFAEDKSEKFIKNFAAVFCHILYLIIPASLLIFLLRAQIIRLLLGASLTGPGLFGWTQTRMTAAALGIFSLSLFAAALIPFLAKVFFSRHNTKTPVKIALVSIFLNIILSFLLVHFLSSINFFQKIFIDVLKLKDIGNISALGLPLAFSISTACQFFLLNFFIKKEIKNLDYHQIKFCLKRIIGAAVLMLIFAYLALNFYALFLATNTVIGLFGQLVFASGVALISYILFSKLLGLSEAKTILSLIKKALKFADVRRLQAFKD